MTAPIRIFIFDDRVEIHSPGTLPNGLTINDIKGGTSLPRNSLLFTNAIYLLPYAGVGSGITRALSEGIDVTFVDNESAREFVTIIKRQIFSAISDTGNGNSDTNAINSESNSDTQRAYSDTSAVNSDTIDENSNTNKGGLDSRAEAIRLKLDKKQKDIVNFCTVPRSSREILGRLGVTYHSKNIARYITSLVSAGYLEMTNPESPNAKNQKYRKVGIH